MSQQVIKVVFACDEAGNFGNHDGSLPWPHIKEDMISFKKETEGCVVVMGQKTWESLPKKLDGRVNVVLSDEPQGSLVKTYTTGGRTHTATPDRVVRGRLWTIIDILCEMYPHRDIAVIGGAGVINEVKMYCDVAVITVVHGNYPADINILEEDTEQEPLDALGRIAIMRQDRDTQIHLTTIKTAYTDEGLDWLIEGVEGGE